MLIGVLAAVVAAHWPLLRLPYYWDEAGYYIPAAYDFFRRGTLIPYSTLSNAHPPLPSIYLAMCWRIFGFSPFVTRTAMCLVASLALLAVYRLAAALMQDRRAAAATAVLTALYPVWFVQSTLAHADLLAAAGTLWGLCFYLGGDESSRRVPSLLPAACCFAMAALSKEIAVGTPLALAAWELWLAWRDRPAAGGHLRAASILTTPALPLAAWFAYHRLRTGFFFGNPEYLRYNATSTLAPLRIALALMHRALHLSAHLNLFVPVLVALGCLLLPRLAGVPSIPKGDRARVLVVILANWIFFSVVGGALLTRYLLPVYPLILLLCVDVWRQRLRHWSPLAALSAAAFVLGLLVNPPYRFAPEDTLAYRDSILLQQGAIAQIESRYGRPTVLTAWPATDELTKPELGYVAEPLPVIAIDNFSYAQIKLAQSRATEEAGGQPYTVALLFSTKYDPPGLLLQLEGRLGQQNRGLDERFFAFHQDLSAEAAARLLGGTIVWQQQRHGQWAAVVHFDRPQLARTEPATQAGAAVTIIRLS
jgi:4-amino-4-deoxy-L-arabinose transferase-like glycosyltransferase